LIQLPRLYQAEREHQAHTG